MNVDENKSLDGLYIGYKSELIRYVIARIGLNKNEAEDVVQNAFVRLSASDLGSIENQRAYLYKATFNIAMDVKRRDYVRHKHVSEIRDDESIRIDERSPERFAGGEERMKIIADALRIMPSQRRQLLILNRFDGLSYAEIARRYNLSETVIRKHIAKAMADCQRALEELSP